MTQPQILTAKDIAPQLLNDFLRRVYPPLKSSFLTRHGAWWHGSDENRLVVFVDGQVAGYCGVIPARVWVDGQVRTALWWVDLVIAPEFRGRGLQTLFDDRVREMADLLLGFPNEVAAKIHRKHGWGVREDTPILMLPLWPRQVKMVQTGSLSRRLGALGLSPFATVWRFWLSIQKPQNAWKMPRFDADVLSAVFQRVPRQDVNTNWRDTPYFNWRYAHAPNPDEYAFYLAGPREAPTHFLIARHITQPNGLRYSRILDVVGDFTQSNILQELLTLVLQDCIRHGAGQVTLFAADPALQSVSRSMGFVFSSPVGFCWLCDDPGLMKALSGRNYWVLADSDNDAPD